MTGSLPSLALAFDLKTSFVDLCTRGVSVFTTPNGNSLKVELRGIDPSRGMNVNIRWGLAGIQNPSSDQTRILNDYRFDETEIPGSGVFYFKLPKARALDQVQMKIPGSRIWNATVTVTQGDEVSVGDSSILRVGEGIDYFQVKETPMCTWSSAPQISSSYYFNSSSGPMWVSKKIVEYSESGMGNEFLPVYFKGKSREAYLNHRIELDRSWKLSLNQGGLFADRLSFSRFEADHLEWKAGDEGGCGHYEVTERGVLDVAEPITEFYTVPKSLTSDSSALGGFLASISPAIQTCSVEELPARRQFSMNTEFLFSAKKDHTTHEGKNHD